MIGLILFAVIAVWISLSLVLANFLGNLLPTQPWKIMAKIFLTPLIFLAPVADELLALPKLRALCEKVKKYEYDENIARGRTVRSTISVGVQETITLFPDINILVERFDHNDIRSNNRVLSWYQITNSGGKLAFPSASGDRNPWILPKKCTVNSSSVEHTQLLKNLNITLAKSETEEK